MLSIWREIPTISRGLPTVELQHRLEVWNCIALYTELDYGASFSSRKGDCEQLPVSPR